MAIPTSTKVKLAFAGYAILLTAAAITLHMYTIKPRPAPAPKQEFVCSDWQVYEMKRVPDGLVLGGFQVCVYGTLQPTDE